MQSVRQFIKSYYVPITIFLISRMVIFMTILLVSLHGFSPIPNLLGWDANNYSFIAEHGYPFDGTFKGGSGFIAYFPLLPVLLSITHLATGIDYVVIGASLSTIFALGAVILMYKLIRDWAGSQVAKTGVMLFSFYPMSIFLSTAYTEALFIFLVLAGLVLIDSKKELRASVFVGLALITRITGSVFGLIFAFDTWQRTRDVWRTILICVLAGFPLLVFLYFQYTVFGTPFAFLIAQRENFSTNSVMPWTGLFLYFKKAIYGDMVYVWRMEIWLVILVIVTLILSFNKVPKYIWWFGFGTLVIVLCSDNVMAMGRFMMPVLPLYFYWGKKLAWRHTAFALVIAVSAGWMVFNTILFVTARHVL